MTACHWHFKQLLIDCLADVCKKQIGHFAGETSRDWISISNSVFKNLVLFIPCIVLLIIYIYQHTWSDLKVRELIAVKVLHTPLLNTTVVAFKVLHLGSYAPMPAPSPPFKTILELVLWNGLQNCRCIIPDVINVNKMPSFQYFIYLREQEKVIGG